MEKNKRSFVIEYLGISFGILSLIIGVIIILSTNTRLSPLALASSTSVTLPAFIITIFITLIFSVI